MTIVTLLDSQNQEVGKKIDDKKNANNFRIEATVGKAVHYVRVEARGNSTGSYTLHAEQALTCLGWIVLHGGMQQGTPTGMREDWGLLVSFLPDNWRELAASTGALKGLRKNKSAESLLRVLLIHLGCGHSLRETAVRARKAQLAELSSVALWKRLRKSQDWLRALCVELFRERGVELAGQPGFQVRAIDATTVQEPGKSGSLWRIHYSVRLPSLACDYFKLTETEGPGTGASLRQFPIRSGDYLLADRGYSTAAGIGHAAAAGGRVTVRVNTGILAFQGENGQPFDLLGKVSVLQTAGAERSWPVRVVAPQGPPVTGRVCAIRKTEEAIRIAQEGIRKEAQHQGRQVQPQTVTTQLTGFGGC